MRARAVVSLGLSVFLWATTTFAETFSVVLDAEPPSCPTQDEFVSRVRSLTTMAQSAAPSQARYRFEVELTRRGESFVGVLTTRSADGQLSRRELSGASCAEVFAALAWIVALHVDPSARPEEPPDDAAPSPAIAPARRAEQPGTSSSLSRPTPSPRRAASSQGLASASAPPAGSPAGAASVQGWLGLEGSLSPNIAPRPLISMGAFVGLQVAGRWELRLAGSYAPSVDTEVREERAKLGAMGGQVAFGWAVHRAEYSGVTLGATGEVLALHARGQRAGRLTEPSDDWVTWVGVGPLLRGHVGNQWRLEGFLALPVSISRYRIWMNLPDPDGNTLFFEAPRWVPRIGLGIAVDLG